MDPLVADEALTRTLFYDEAQASQGGLHAYAAFAASHNHPQYHYTAAECYAFFRKRGFYDSSTMSEVPDVAAMAPDPGWALPANSGRYAGLVPTGRTYILPIQYTVTNTQSGPQVSQTYQGHVTILNGTAYYFATCE